MSHRQTLYPSLPVTVPLRKAISVILPDYFEGVNIRIYQDMLMPPIYQYIRICLCHQQLPTWFNCRCFLLWITTIMCHLTYCWQDTAVAAVICWFSQAARFSGLWICHRLFSCQYWLHLHVMEYIRPTCRIQDYPHSILICSYVFKFCRW